MPLKPKLLRLGAMLAVEVESPTKREAFALVERKLREVIVSMEQEQIHRIKLVGEVTFLFDPFNLPPFEDEG